MRTSPALAPVLAIAFALAAGPAALAQDAGLREDPPRITEYPKGADQAPVWPRDASGNPIAGRAFVVCTVSPAGALSGCRAARENPAGAGIGEAALKLVPKFKVTPARRENQPVESTIVLPVDFFPTDKDPDWLRKPTADDLLAVYPTEAMRRGWEGRAVISCLISAQGAAYDCVPIYEDPPRAGFGSAAVALTPQFLFRPAQLRGTPVVSSANIPIAFKTAGGGPPPSGSRKVVSPVSVWLEAPTVADVTAAYPEKARKEKVGGRATVACNFASSGRPINCRTIAEQPKNKGFAGAARDLAKKFLAQAPEGQRITSAMVQLPFAFDPALLESDEPVVGRPSWAGLPSDQEMKAVLAPLPKNLGSVRVSLSCRVEQQGRMSGCRVQSENPAGRGFGQAALSLSPRFVLSTWTAEGLPVVGGRVQIPLRFETDEPKPTAAK